MGQRGGTLYGVHSILTKSSL
uniref:Uncharacterized protein n=1 Tax=Rhizophora mucronata TaxID=61149 RepID=A0A2P2NK27_RHIMU